MLRTTWLLPLLFTGSEGAAWSVYTPGTEPPTATVAKQPATELLSLSYDDEDAIDVDLSQLTAIELEAS
tara:strand:- start:230 stop:436 length:207 start_codon:yes stop_codon:yes gene_type:complete